MTRRSIAITVTTLLAIAFNSACNGKHSTTIQNDEGEPAATKTPIVSVLNMGDPSAKDQLTAGFYALEGSWRWTAGKFSVSLKTPPGAAQNGATLTLALTIPDVNLKQLHSQTLTATVGKAVLKSEKYADAGPHKFVADIPSSTLTGDTVAIDFSLDNVVPPTGEDKRPLGVIVNSVGIETK